MVSLVVSRHRHDGARAVAHQNKIGDPNRNFLSAKGIDRIESEGYAFFLSGLKIDLANAATGTLCNKCFYFGIVGRGGNGKRVIRGHGHESRPKNSIRPGRKYPEWLTAIGQGKVDLQPG